MSAKSPAIWLLHKRKIYSTPKNYILDNFNVIPPQTYWRLMNIGPGEQPTETEIILANQIRERDKRIYKMYSNHETIPTDLVPKNIYPMYHKVKPVKVPLFAIYAVFIIINQTLADILQNSRFGNNQIQNLQLYNTESGTLEKSPYYFINICESYRYAKLKEGSNHAREYSGTNDSQIVYDLPNNQDEADNFSYTHDALNCPVDIWHDPLIRSSIFISDVLKNSISDAKLKKFIPLLSCDVQRE